MVLRISEEPIDRLGQHASIPIAFRVERILSVSAPGSGLGGIRLSGAAVERPWVKDYDAIKGEGPTRWPKRFDTSNWGLIAAYDGPDRVGGAVIAFNTTGVHMLEGRSDTAVLWDLRVGPEYRSSGIGSSLFRAAEVWCSHRACNLLKVETQNINCPPAASTHGWGAPSAPSTPGRLSRASERGPAHLVQRSAPYHSLRPSRHHHRRILERGVPVAHSEVDRRAGRLRDSTIEDRISSFWSRPSRTVGPSAGVPLEVVGA